MSTSLVLGVAGSVMVDTELPSRVACAGGGDFLLDGPGDADESGVK